MNNYEYYKEKIDAILDNGGGIGVNKDTNETMVCERLDCGECLFSYRYNKCNHCGINRIKWLVSEYKEPEVNWSEILIDTPVLISVDGKNGNWFNRYFAGVNEKGQPTVFSYGATQWSNGYEKPCYFKYIKLAEVE